MLLVRWLLGAGEQALPNALPSFGQGLNDPSRSKPTNYGYSDSELEAMAKAGLPIPKSAPMKLLELPRVG
jgi:hypothetical protein